MMAGLPGTGVGGLFYLLAALALPVRLAWLWARGRSERGHAMLVIRLLAMSASMMAAVWLTGALLGLWSPLPAMVAVAPIIFTVGTLVVILVAVEIARLVIRPPAGFGRGRLHHRARDGQGATRFLDMTDCIAPARAPRTGWPRPRSGDATPAIRIRREREEPPITLA